MKILSLPWNRPQTPPVEPVPPDVPDPEGANVVPEGADDFVSAMTEAREEPLPLRGVVFQQSPGQRIRVLRNSGETKDTLPADIPASAVKNNRVVIYSDGIHHELPEEERHIEMFLQGASPEGANVLQDVIGIHEGAGKSTFHDSMRIGKVLGLRKLLESGLVSPQWASKKLFAIDPAVKSVHDEVKQSLLAGRKVQLMAHSGGGAETAAALTLLKREGMGDQIRDNVRLLSIAPAASYKDLVQSGVKEENLYYTGSKHDPVYSVFHHHLGALSVGSDIGFGVAAGKFLVSMLHKDPNRMVYHSPDYIFAHNMDENGQRIQRFLDGGPGGYYELS